MISRAATLAIRIASALALVLVATYYLLASIPFSYHQFLQFPHFWWLPLFITIHPLVLLAGLIGLLRTVGDARSSLKPWIRYVAIGAVTTVACMAIIVWQPRLMSYELASVLCFAPPLLLAMISGIELAGDRDMWGGVARPRTNIAPFLGAAATAGTLCSMVYFLDAAFRGATDSLRAREIVVAGATSVATHVAVFVFAALVVTIINMVAARRRWPRFVELIATGCWATIVLTVVLRRSILTALILSDRRANAVAAALSIAIVLFWAALNRPRSRASHVASPTEAGPLPQSSAIRQWRVGSMTAVVALSVGVLPRMLLFADWGSTIQKLVVFATWTAIVLLVSGLATRRGRRMVMVGGLATVLAAVAASGSVSGASAQRTSEDGRSVDVSLAIDRYATFDMSMTVLLDVLRPLAADDDFYQTLRRVGDLSDDSSLSPVALRAADEPRTSAAYRPNIFIIVVDSMRPDYLSAYNSSVTFTPAIGAFAADSIVMRNAFASYAGTALSEPALWAGGLIPRAIYIKPFSPMNNLERLLRSNDYRRYISMDEVLHEIIDDWSGVVRLDTYLADPQRADVFKLDLCPTLKELAGRLDRDAGGRPVFFYSQPKSLHIRVLVGEEQYPRYEALRIGNAQFFKPAATVVQRLDACFGEFINHLKATGAYDDSIIILTADHGDAYGDAGRWGHAFYLAPETLRIPLILHVPQKLRAGRRFDPNAVALLTDVTPTLYDLLGVRLTNASRLLGHSLLPRIDEAPQPDGEPLLVQSSYSRVFGLLDRRGRWLYTADVNHWREQFFDLAEGGPYPKALKAADRLQYRKWLMERLDEVGRYYRPAAAN